MNRLPLIALTAALASCSTSPNAATEAQNAVTGLTKLYADIQADLPNAVPKGSPVDLDIQAALTAAQASATALPTLAASAQGANLGTVASDAGQVLNLLAVALPPGTLPSDVMAGLQAAEIIIPDLLALSGTVGGPAGKLPLPARFAAPAGMTVAQAQMVLAGVR